MSGGRTDGGCVGCLGRLLAMGLKVGLVLFLLGLIGATIAVMEYRDFERTPVLEPGASTVLHIPPNTNWPEVLERVDEAEIVKSKLFFDIWGRQVGLSESVRAGTFYLEGPMGLEEFAEHLRRGGTAQEVTVTFPEGWTIFQFADQLEASGLVGAQSFLEYTRDPEGYDWLPNRAESLEGYLYPDTYRFNRDTTVERIIDRLVERWKDKADPVFERHHEEFETLRQEYGFDRHDVVTMASLIERETAVDSERDVIARVFYNRLDRQMLLQTDPTCVYGADTYHLEPTPELCRDPSNRYSTYVIQGLPPGPIASPSQASLSAALAPSTDPDVQDYLFFVSRRDGTGAHYFSTDYAEHRRAIERYLRN